jgi:hypothetical protein
MAFIDITYEEYNTSYKKITHLVYNVLNHYKHTWTSFLIFSSWMRLSLPMMVLTVHGSPTLGCMKIHMRWQNVIFSGFSVNTCFWALGSYHIGPHFIEGHHTAAYHRDFLQNGLQLLLEDVLVAT